MVFGLVNYSAVSYLAQTLITIDVPCIKSSDDIVITPSASAAFFMPFITATSGSYKITEFTLVSPSC